MKALAWQVHVYGSAEPALEAFCTERNILLYVRPWTDDCRKSGLQKDALYLVRPDGHIGFAEPTQDVAALRRFWESVHVSVSASPSYARPAFLPRGYTHVSTPLATWGK
jgi:hypothetical protein